VTPLNDGSAWVVTPEGLSLLHMTNTMEIETITVDEGLVTNSILSLAAMPDGTLWVGTDNNGLSRYDGNTWETYRTKSITGNITRFSAEDSTGCLWFGTDGGISCFKNGEWTQYTMADGIPDNNIRGIWIDPHDGVWVAAGSNLGLFRNGTWTWWSGIECDLTAFDREGYLFVVGGGKLYIHDGSRLEKFLSEGVQLVTTDPDGNVWVSVNKGSTDFDLLRFDGRNAIKVTSFNAGTEYISQLAFDREGRIWTASFNTINMFDGESWSRYTLAEGLLHNTSGISFDRDGTPWSWSTDKGIARFDEGSWTLFPSGKDVPSDIRLVINDQEGDLWFLSRRYGATKISGATRYSSERWIPSSRKAFIYLECLRYAKRTLLLHFKSERF